MKKVYLFCLVMLFGGCSKDYIQLSSDLKEDISVEMYLVNDPSCVKLDKPIVHDGFNIESVSKEPFLRNDDCLNIYYIYDNRFKDRGLVLLLKENNILERESGDEIIIKANNIIIGYFTVGVRSKGKSFFWRMPLSELEKNVKDKNKIFYDKIKELEDKKK